MTSHNNKQNQIRNVALIAHIDHGKSTLADRLIEKTGAVAAREMKEQLLDQMDLERERGITIKLQPVQLEYSSSKGGNKKYILNVIDTPGHVDFSYEVSRTLAAVEGAILIVDAAQGIQAQTLAHLYVALERNLTIIPVLNKIDLPAADPDRVANEIVNIIGGSAEDIIRVSAKTGENVEELLEAIVARVPAPGGDPDKPLRALVFDSAYNTYQGVIAYVRVIDGALGKNDSLTLMQSGMTTEAHQVGVLKPKMLEKPQLATGQTGYIVTGLKDVREARVGETVSHTKNLAAKALPGYQQIQPNVFAGIFTDNPDDYPELTEALAKLQLNDASLSYEGISSPTGGAGYRIGALGLLHLDIIQERLKREFDLELITTSPSVTYQVITTTNEKITARIPSELPDPTVIQEIQEPWVALEVITPSDYLGNIMQILQDRRAIQTGTESIDDRRLIVHYEIPLAEIIGGLYDTLKSASRGFASMNYSFKEYRMGDLVKLDVLVAGDPIEAFARIVPRIQTQRIGRQIVERLAELIPPQMFAVPVQAAVGGKIIARANIKAQRKDVTAKLYGGDVTRKRKLLEKQKAGKKKMREKAGGINIPSDVYRKML
ncbi:translation elongation factor 4 [Patescibacteria group bacterium]